MKIGVGIVTYQRFDRFKESFENLLKNCRDVDDIVIVDDCSIKDKEKYDEYFDNILLENIRIIRNRTNLGVGASKNKILKYFHDREYDYIFTIEDDINIKNPDVFKKYIEASVKTGYDYINFALHGDHNKVGGFKHKINNFEIMFYPNIVGAFTIYTKHLLDVVGYHDERFLNAWEHVEYTYRASLKGLTPPFWNFIDIVNSNDYLEEQTGALADSSIRPRPDWKNNINNGLRLFKEIHGVSLFDIPRPRQN